ncbi:MAG: recombination protein NinB [Bacteroidales bacterium]
MIINNEKDKLIAIERLKDLDLEKGPWQISIKKKRKRRSLDQNNLMWLWLTALENDSGIGYTKEEWKSIFQSMFCPRVTVYVGENKIEKLKGTSELNTKEFSELLDKIRLFAHHELGMGLPNPDEPYFEEFYELYND